MIGRACGGVVVAALGWRFGGGDVVDYIGGGPWMSSGGRGEDSRGGGGRGKGSARG